MVWTLEQRQERRFQISKLDQRRDFERDHDRILYTSAFHRLAGITQIVRAGEQDIFHTRQQHTYKVAQIARRLAQWCCSDNEQLATYHGVDPEVAAAAALAHDLGHPPFGHAAETELDKLVCAKGDLDGYEGNAQTFRILTKLAVRYDHEECAGLDLTRATLAATLKYPWLRDQKDKKKRDKWSAYRSEEQDFAWAREFAHGEFKTAEAELMDWADDIAYSVHDLEDFHRVGIIPWRSILAEDATTPLVGEIVKRWFDAPPDAVARMRRALNNVRNILELFPAVTGDAYDGSRRQRKELRTMTSTLIGRFVRSVRLLDPGEGRAVQINSAAEDEVRLLKHLARHYVISLPALAAQQFGQKKIIRELFAIFFEAGSSQKLGVFPARMRYIWENYEQDTPARKTADCIATLTEREAEQLYRRLTGMDGGSVLDPIVR